MLEQIVKGLPTLEQVTFNRHGPSVQRDSELMSRLQEAVLKGQKRIAWAKGKWVDEEEENQRAQRKEVFYLVIYESLKPVIVSRVLRSDLLCMREAIRSLAIQD